MGVWRRPFHWKYVRGVHLCDYVLTPKSALFSLSILNFVHKLPCSGSFIYENSYKLIKQRHFVAFMSAFMSSSLWGFLNCCFTSAVASFSSADHATTQLQQKASLPPKPYVLLLATTSSVLHVMLFVMIITRRAVTRVLISRCGRQWGRTGWSICLFTMQSKDDVTHSVPS